MDSVYSRLKELFCNNKNSVVPATDARFPFRKLVLPSDGTTSSPYSRPIKSWFLLDAPFPFRPLARNFIHCNAHDQSRAAERHCLFSGGRRLLADFKKNSP